MIGYRKRFGDFVDGMVGSLNAGVQLWRRHISISAFTERVLAFSEDSDPLSVATREYLYIQGAVSVGGFEPLPGVSVGFALGRVVVAENSAKGTNLSFSVSYQR